MVLVLKLSKVIFKCTITNMNTKYFSTMKTIKHMSIIATVMLAVFTTLTVSAGMATDMKKADQQDFKTIKGKVVDAENGTPLVFATVAVKESNVAIVTNIDGEFTLKIGDTGTSKNLEISFLGL